jgi:type II secretory pathway component GspD/PulD (secretin)
VVINLKEYFAEELAADEDDQFYDYFFGYGGGSSDDGAATLGKRRKLRFIWDPDTNTILVQNASPAQIQVIDELIRIYDQGVGEDSVARRRTEVIKIEYSRAADIATALKEVYRDLLSSKDKEFENEGDGDRGGGSRSVYYSFSSGSSNTKKTAPVKMSFEGALSVGVDSVSNTLIISAEEQIFENVVQIVEMLDQQARPDTVVQVHELRGAIPAEDLQQALSTALSRPWQGGQPQAGQGGGDGRRGDGDRDRRRRRRDRDND